jgi:hypothetical protein
MYGFSWPFCAGLFFIIFMVSWGVVMIAGKIMRGNAMAFLIENVDHFAADDITAMTLGVHKALLSAVDSVGLKSSLLRVKEHFVAGSGKRII